MIAVIADDITGAAEMAGIGFRYGLTIHFVTRLGDCLPESDLLVYATDTRSMSSEEAVEETCRVVRELRSLGIRRLFKKTDSALRGHIVEELRALLEETDYRDVLLLPQNPSRGRTIEEGIYYMNGTPIAETDFAFDPEFPALTSSVKERFPEVFIADAHSVEDIREHLGRCHDTTLLAGAADLFAAYLESLGHQAMTQTPFSGLETRDALIVCGSTQSISLEDTPYCRRKGIHLCRMPYDVFKGFATPDSWMDSLRENYHRQGSLLLTIGHPAEGGKTFALRLRHTLAAVVNELISSRLPQEVIIEGGATAFAILKEIDWQRFLITDEIAPGVIRMKSGAGAYVTLKPGSYQWGEVLFG